MNASPFSRFEEALARDPEAQQNPDKGSVTIQMPRDLYEALLAMAEKDHRSLTGYCRLTLRQHVEGSSLAHRLFPDRVRTHGFRRLR